MDSHSHPHALAQSANVPRSQRPPVATEATLAEVLRDLDTGLEGLSAEQARTRLAQYGANAVSTRSTSHPLVVFFRQFLSPMVIILLLAAALSFALGQPQEASIVCVIVLLSSGLSYYQEYRADNALAELERRVSLNVVVLRDKAQVGIPLADIVPGDVVVLKSGNIVPADGLLADADEVYADEAALTGESYPVEKVAAPLDASVNDVNRLHMGTSIRSGQGLMLVTRTGSRTEYGKLAGLLVRNEPETSFAKGVRQFGLMMTQVMLVLVTVVLVANVLLGRPVLESLLFAAALAVGITPELLPAIVSVTLSQGARQLAGKGVLTRRLVAIENLGAMDVLCVDKTGTLTQAELTLTNAVDARGMASDATLKWARVNAALQTALPSPLDDAILANAGKVDLAPYGKLGEAAYDFERKRLSVMVEGPEGCILVCKGAAAGVLDACVSISAPSGAVALSESERAEANRLLDQWGDQGLRVLAVAIREMSATDDCSPKAETGMTLIGYLLFSDPLKPGIADSVRALKTSGIDLRIISGDSRRVAQHVAEQVGLASRVLVGPDLVGLDDRAFARRVLGVSVFAEIAPDQKERIVATLRKAGHTVGYLGDGINDAPALRAADVGISVDNAVDAARAAADVILLERDLMVLLDGVTAGRRAFSNTIKYITITISANLGNMLSMALASLILPFLPLTASQVLLNNLLSDLPMLAISTDRVDASMLRLPWRWNFRALLRSMGAYGLVSSLFDALTFVVLLGAFGADASMFQSAWFLESLLTELAVVAVMRTQMSLFAGKPSRLLLLSSIAVAVLAFVLPYTPVGELVGLEPLPLPLLATLVAIGMAYVATTELLKRVVLPFELKPVTASAKHG